MRNNFNVAGDEVPVCIGDIVSESVSRFFLPERVGNYLHAELVIFQSRSEVWN
jgi:hypothetical protein